LDEPLGALDLKLREQMQVELKGIQRDVGITFLFVTHDQNEALTLCDRLAVMRDGRIEQVGRAEDVYESPATRFVAEFVGTSNLISGARAHQFGGSAHVAVRPERVQVLTDGREPAVGDVVLNGTVRELVYAGAETRVVVDAGDGLTMTALLLNTGPGDMSLRRGQQVRLAWPVDAAHPLAVSPATTASTETAHSDTAASSDAVPTAEEGNP
jgi:putative spermidine/putrescine transport system ATP-binding protein